MSALPIRIVLVEPSHPGNIGATARAMKNMALRELVLVQPKQFPHAEATARASGADDVLAEARVVGSVAEALEGCGFVAATTSRERDQNFRVLDVRAAAERIVAEARTSPAAVLFGAERTGLTNEEVILADAFLTVPTNPDFSSLNLAQSVAVVAYEWWKGTHDKPEFKVPAKFRRAKAANKEDLIGFFEHIEAELDRTEFLFPADKRAAMVQNMRNMWQRAGLTYQEVQTLRGMVRALTGGKKRKKKDE